MKFSGKEPGFLISGATHVALLLFGLFAVAAPKPFDEFAEATPIDVVSDAEFQQMTKGDIRERQVVPNAPRRVDRVAKVEEDREPGAAKTNVPAPPPPPTRPDVKQAAEDLDEAAPAAAAPPPRVARVEPPLPPARPVETPKPEPKPEPKKQAMSAPAKSTSTEEEEEEEEAEIIRQRQKKIDAEKAAEARKAEENRKEEARREEARKEEARRQAEREKQEAIRKAADAQRLEDERKKEEARKEEARKEEARKLAERREAERERQREEAAEREEERKEAEREKAEQQRKAAEAKKIAEARQRQIDEQKKKAAEAARKLAEQKKAEEARKAAERAESEKLNAAIRNRLLAAQGAPSSSGSTGAQVTRTASAGTPTGTGQKLSQSEKGELAGLIKEQMERCWSVTTTTNPAVKPLVRLQLGQNGAIIAAPALLNGGDQAFQAVADSGMRAIRQCSPYRIPAKFADKYNDWKTITVKLDPSDLL